MFSVEEIRFSDEENTEEVDQDEDDWEGCCEDVLMDDEFYEREYCD